MANVPITSLPTASALTADSWLILQGASTQKIKWSAILNTLYPIGCIYQSTSSTSPASFLGGTWERIKDRFLLAAGDTTYSAGKTGGESTVKLSKENVPSLDLYINGNEKYPILTWANDGDKEGYYTSVQQSKSSNNTQNLATSTNGGTAHNNMPPYLTVYTWKRTA